MVEKLDSVGSWLKDLRYSTESYDHTLGKIESEDDMNVSRRNSGEYVNIWECESDQTAKRASETTKSNVSEYSYPLNANVTDETLYVHQFRNHLDSLYYKTPVVKPSQSIDSWYSFPVSHSSSENSINLSDVNSDLDESVTSYVYYNGKEDSCSDYYTDALSVNSNVESRTPEPEHVYANLTELKTYSPQIQRIYENVSDLFLKRQNSNVSGRVTLPPVNVNRSFTSMRDLHGYSKDSRVNFTESPDFKDKRFEEQSVVGPEKFETIHLHSDKVRKSDIRSSVAGFDQETRSTDEESKDEIDYREGLELRARPKQLVLNLSFGEVCRVSVDFNENIEELNIVKPVKVEYLVPEVGLDVMLWKERIRYSCWEEEENIMENNEELLKSFNQLSNQKSAKFDNRFPLDENDEDQVQIRKNDSIKRDIRRDHSKTTDGTIGRLRNHNRHKKFDIRGLTKIQLPHERSPIKLSHEYVMYENDGFYKVNEVGNMKALLRRNVILKSARPLNSKNVELKDCNDLSYILYFDSSKDAKIFIENEKIQGYVNNDNKTTITKTLLKLLGKRSSREILERKGIYKNEPIFGNTLRDIYTKGGNEVPPFIYKVIELIERPENITSLGLYRTSGNLATIQKIRFEVDNGRLGILDEFSKDVDVLTGSLKLFFRELKEPLITCEICDEILGSIKLEPKLFSKKDKEKLRSILCKNLHDANLETLFVLIRHLLEVVKFKEENKMDPYNLAVCWGPSSIFSVNQELSRDIVTQSQDATRLIEFLLNFYKEHPEELYYFGGKKLDYCPLIRQGSKDSIGSYESSSKNSKKSSSTASLSVDEIIRKPIEIIELNINSEGLYKKSGSVEKTNKIMKKLTKKKIHELDKHKNDVYDVTDALKKYLRESQDAFVTKDTVDRVIAVAESFQNSTLDLKAAQTIVKNVEETTKKDTFIFILKHIIKVVENHNFHKVSKTDIINIWTNILNYQKKVHPVNEVFSKFLTILLDVFDDNKKFEKSDVVTQKNNAALNNVLKDLKFQQEKDRYSRYDNVSDNECRGEACFLDRKTENTKL